MALGSIKPFLKLIKLRLGLSILITVLPAMFLGAYIPSFKLLFFCLLGTFLVASASFVYNEIIEVSKDALMKRTRNRPLVTGEITHAMAHMIASSLLGVGLFFLVIYVNVLAGLIALFSFLYYVFIYTLWLKPRTSWNTVVGGISGSVGPLIGEASVTGRVSEYGISMFILLFLWQPPHFWSLGIRYREEYKIAGFPILPVVKGVHSSIQQMIVYQFLLCIFIFSIALPPLNLAGMIFLIPSSLIGFAVLYTMIRTKNQLKKGTLPREKLGSECMKIFFLTILHMIVWHFAFTFDFYFR